MCMSSMSKNLIALSISMFLVACVNTSDSGDSSTVPLPDPEPGALDSSFGSNGVVVIDLGSSFKSSAGKGLQLSSDGKILIGAETWPVGRADSDFSLLRLNSDGSVDGSFNNANNNGVVVTDLDNFSNEHLACMSVDSAGHILLSGHKVSGGWDIANARYNASGELDNSFGDNNSGISTTAFPVSGAGASIAYSKAIGMFPDNSFVVAGRTNNGGSFFDVALARYDANGLIDISFNGVGTLNVDFNGGDDNANAVAVVGNPSLSPDSSRIFVAGFANSSKSVGHGKDFLLMKYDISGQLDTTFNATDTMPGAVIMHQTQNDAFNAIALQSDGKIVVAGTAGGINTMDFVLMRFNADGSLDTTFNGSGYKTTDLGGRNDEITAIAIDSSGRIIAAGKTDSLNDAGDFAVVRYNSDGSEDLSFADNGVLRVPVSAGEDVVTALALQGNGIYVLGSADSGSNNEKIAVLRVFQ